MSLYIPQMNIQTSRNNWGQSVANNLLDAVRMNRQYELAQNKLDLQRQDLQLRKDAIADAKDQAKRQFQVQLAGEKDRLKEKEYERAMNKYDRDLTKFEQQKKKDYRNPLTQVMGNLPIPFGTQIALGASPVIDTLDKALGFDKSRSKKYRDEFREANPLPEQQPATLLDAIEEYQVMPPQRYLRDNLDPQGNIMSTEEVLNEIMRGY